ncbi:MAG: 50S ribosomal protein L21 [Mycoplasmataceae bacterium]|jgi:large subunit ribosomal protein L21|nr:50S ribosomal protein L21 [Mycoplasmataceae bacterium]
MLAIIKVGGKQYMVNEGTSIYVEKIDQEPGSEVVINDVIMVDDIIGKPYVENASVKCVVKKHGKQPKIHIIHHIPQKHHTKRMGHRQPYTQLEVKSINK